MHIMASTARHDATRDSAMLAGTRVSSVFLYVASMWRAASPAHGWGGRTGASVQSNAGRRLLVLP